MRQTGSGAASNPVEEEEVYLAGFRSSRSRFRRGGFVREAATHLLRLCSPFKPHTGKTIRFELPPRVCVRTCEGR